MGNHSSIKLINNSITPKYTSCFFIISLCYESASPSLQTTTKLLSDTLDWSELSRVFYEWNHIVVCLHSVQYYKSYSCCMYQESCSFSCWVLLYCMPHHILFLIKSFTDGKWNMFPIWKALGEKMDLEMTLKTCSFRILFSYRVYKTGTYSEAFTI